MRKLLLLVLFVITAKVLFAQSLFQKQLAIGYDSYLSDVVCNESDSTYYYVGRIMVIESSAFVQKPIVFKTDNMGNIIWFKIIVVSPVLDSSSIFTRIINIIKKSKCATN